MYKLFRKEIDDQGRIILPREWRNHLKSKKVLMIQEDAVIKIVSASAKLSSFYDKAKPSTMKIDPFQDYDKALVEASLR